MSEIVWMTVLSKRVTAVRSDICSTELGRGEYLFCAFNPIDCNMDHNGTWQPACRALKDPKHMFITEDQFPAYLAARLTGEA